MAGELTKAQVETILKRKVVDKIRDYVPDGCKLIKKLKGKPIEKDGREYLEPVCLSLENGATYGDDTAFVYNDSINGEYGELELESNPFVMQSRLNLKAFNRLKDNEAAIGKRLGHRFLNLKKSTCKRAELSYWYGDSGLARTVAGAAAKTASGDLLIITLTPRSFSEGIWGGMKNAWFDLYDDDDATKLNAQPLEYQKINVDPSSPNYRQVTFKCENATVATNLAGNENSCFVYFFGEKGKNMIGIDKQISTQTGTMFNISKDDYELFRGNVFPCGNSWSMSKILLGLSGALSVGGLSEDVTVWMHNSAFTDLNIDEAALREYDKSYEGTAKRGNDEIEFRFQGGKIKILPYLYAKRGEAFAIPDRCFKRIGATDMEFITDATEEGQKNKDYLRSLENTAAYQVLFGYDHHILIPEIALCTKYTELVADS